MRWHETRRRVLATGIAVTMVSIGATVVASPTPAAAITATPNYCQAPIDRVASGPVTQSVATGLRIGRHRTFDRVVLDLTQTPGDYRLPYVPSITEDGSGLPVPLRGTAFLELRTNVDAHDQNGHGTIPVRNYVVNWGSILQVRIAGDFGGILQVGIGLRSKVDFVVTTLSGPNRLVIDVAHPGQHPWSCTSGAVKVYFQNLPRFDAGTPPYVTPVWRRVAIPAVAFGALTAATHWPTDDESTAGLALETSRCLGFDRLSITGGVARVRLLGDCSSGGSTFTVADEVFPILKQFPTVKWVKIYDQNGTTERPNGLSDSIPTCLEP